MTSGSNVARGMYDQQLAYWRSVYPAESFCIVSFEMLESEPVRTLEVVSGFIGLREYNWASVTRMVPKITYAGAVVRLD